MQSVDDLDYLESKYDADDFSKKELSEIINNIIKELPSKNAAVVTMFYLEEMSSEEISQALDISVSNVKVILYRSRNLLKDIIQKKDLLKEFL